MKQLSVPAFLFVVIALTISACQPIQASQVVIQPTSESTTVPTDIPAQIETEAPSSEAPTGSIQGRLGYPSEVVPAMRVVAFQYGTDKFFSVDTAFNQSTYQLDGLAEGKYHVVAYTVDDGNFPAGLAGGYTQAVVCGMEENCSDHTLVDVVVGAGQVVEQVNIFDWLIPLPPMPEPGQPVLGAITGRLSYPSEFIPPMKVVAYRVSDNQMFGVDTQMYDGFYTLAVPAGVYRIVAYVGGAEADQTSQAGGYSQMVPCGLSVECTDHSLIEVSVEQGGVTYNIDPADFYAPEGTFPTLP